MPTAFKFKSETYPLEPGVYLMKDASGRIIYVGKAKELKKRLSSYFGSRSGLSTKTRALVDRIAAVDVLPTSTEKEALLLEASLIKKHKPRYNVVLRDDKQYVLFRLNRRADYPRLTMTRKVVRDGSVYFGPFTSARDARETWKLVVRTFPLRKCGDNVFRNRVRPCLYHDIGQCLAPCVLDVDKSEYRNMVRKVEMFLGGRTQELLSGLREEMVNYSRKLEFEKAAEIRDLVRSVQRTVERQVAVLDRERDLDALALSETEKGLGLGAVFVRRGRLLDGSNYFWPGLGIEDGEEVLAGFIKQFYGTGRYVPGLILAPFVPDEPLLSEVLSEQRQGQVRIKAASTAEEKRLLDIARKQALRANLDEEQDITEVLWRKMKLSAKPERIECVDASHLGGEGLKVGQVVYENGKRKPEDSRLYAFPDLEGTGDDYAAMSAWVTRRVESGSPWPDLVLIDGGRGQLSAVERALKESGQSWELAAIAKGESRRAGELGDRIFRPGRKNHLPFKAGSAELLFLQNVRDSAHRFVIGRQRKSRKSKMLKSELMSLPGIGPKTARLLWDRFNTIDNMVNASVDAIRSIPGIGMTKADSIHRGLKLLKK